MLNIKVRAWDKVNDKELKAQLSILRGVWIIHPRNVDLQLPRDGSLKPTFTVFFLALFRV